MFFAARTVQRFKVVALAIVCYGLLALALAFFWPGPGASTATAFMRWLLGIPVALGAWACLELFGQWALSQPFWRHMPSWARIGLLVLVIGVATMLAIGAQQLLTAPNAA